MILRTGKVAEPMAKAAKPNLMTRLGMALDVARGKQVDLSNWFGPLEPLAPVAPEEVAGRRFDFPTGFNLVTAPRGVDAEGAARVSFKQLRDLADGFDVMRLVIETRKDQLVKLKWLIQARDEAKRKGEKSDPRVKQATSFLEKPDREHDWETWLRAATEDMLVIDATTVYPRKTNGGDLYALELVDGATIKPVIDDHGRRPLAPAPAYQQVLKGLPAVDYRADELFYFPRNYRTGFVYGFPPVEQVIMSVNIAVRRQLHQLEYYTSGTVPDMLCPVPESWSPDQIGQFQQYWDALMANNTAERRRVRFVPTGIGKGAVQTKEAALKDDYDEWLARIVSYAFSVSPQWAVKQMNRATAESAQEQALQEGLAPLKCWVKKVIDRALAEAMCMPDLEFAWVEEDATDPKEQADILDGMLAKGAITLNEHRKAFGRDPYPAWADTPLIFTAAGAVTAESVALSSNDSNQAPNSHQEGVQSANQGRTPRERSEAVFQRPGSELNGGFSRGASSGKPAAAKAGGGMAKAESIRQDAPHLRRGPVDRNRPSRRKAAEALAQTFGRVFDRESKRLAALAKRGALGAMKKADDPNGVDDFLDVAAWESAEEAARKILRDQAVDGVGASLAAIGLDDADLTKLANDDAVAWSNRHAAELVAKVKTATRDQIRALVTQSESEGTSVATLADKIADATAFGDRRAYLIAHTETRFADNQGSLFAWQQAKQIGVKLKKKWILEGDNPCPICESNAADGAIDVDDDFNSGDDAPPAHPRCECDLEPVQDDDN